MPRSIRVPSYRRHKARNLAMVVVSGKTTYLGRWNSPESKVEYARFLKEWAVAPVAEAGKASADLTVSELLVGYFRYAERHYRDPDGEPTAELQAMKDAAKPLRSLYGPTVASDFGPLAIRAVRGAMVESGLARKTVNHRVDRIRRIFKWAASVELVRPSIVQGLATVQGLQQGRTEAREAPTVGPVALTDVEATLPFLSPTVAGIVKFQLATGCRAGEACSMRRNEIHDTPDGKVYVPTRHKGSWRGKGRTIPLGPNAVAAILPYMDGPADGIVFSPSVAVQEVRASRAAGRKTPVQPSQVARAKAKKSTGIRLAGERYDAAAYGSAIRRACLRGGVPRWSPLQLRHTAATMIRAKFGLEAAQSVLGHARADVTQVYAERDLGKARRVADAIG